MCILLLFFVTFEHVYLDSTVTDSVSKEKDTKQDGGIVYDSATLKMSVKDKIAKKNAESGVDIPVKKEDKRQKLTMTESSSQEMKTSVQEAKKDAFTNASAKSDVKKGNSLPRETTPDEIDKGVFLSQDDLQGLTDLLVMPEKVLIFSI